jgi:hypothetical protein
VFCDRCKPKKVGVDALVQTGCAGGERQTRQPEPLKVWGPGFRELQIGRVSFITYHHLRKVVRKDDLTEMEWKQAAEEGQREIK